MPANLGTLAGHRLNQVVNNIDCHLADMRRWLEEDADTYERTLVESAIETLDSARETIKERRLVIVPT